MRVQGMRVQVVCRLFPQPYAGVLYIPCADLVEKAGALREYYFVICKKNSARLGIGNGYEGQNS